MGQAVAGRRRPDSLAATLAVAVRPPLTLRWTRWQTSPAAAAGRDVVGSAYWPTTLIATSSSCSPRRMSPASAASRVGRCIGRLRGANCERRDSVTGSGFCRLIWSAGSGSRRSRSILRLGPKGRCLLGKSLTEACALCSTRLVGIGGCDERREDRAERRGGLAGALARRPGPRALQGDRSQARRRSVQGRGRQAQAHRRSRPAHRRPRNAVRVRGGMVEALRGPQPCESHASQLRRAVGSAHPSPTRLDAAQRDHAGSGGALPGRTGSGWRGASYRAQGARAAPRRPALCRRVAADRAQPGQGREESRRCAAIERCGRCRRPLSSACARQQREGGAGMGRETRP